MLHEHKSGGEVCAISALPISTTNNVHWNGLSDGSQVARMASNRWYVIGPYDAHASVSI